HTPTVGTPERAQPVHRPRGHLYFLDGHPLTVTGPARFGSGEGLTGERLGSSGGEQRRGRGSAAFPLSRSQADCLGGHSPGFPDDVTAEVVGVAGKGARAARAGEDVPPWFPLCPPNLYGFLGSRGVRHQDAPRCYSRASSYTS